jgi:hypothetical protein
MASNTRAGGEDETHAGQGLGPGGIDGHEAGVGVERAEDGRLQQAGRADVGHEPAGPGGQAVAAQTGVRDADHRAGTYSTVVSVRKVAELLAPGQAGYTRDP